LSTEQHVIVMQRAMRAMAVELKYPLDMEPLYAELEKVQQRPAALRAWLQLVSVEEALLRADEEEALPEGEEAQDSALTLDTSSEVEVREFGGDYEQSQDHKRHATA
jgi:hypothetical protein